MSDAYWFALNTADDDADRDAFVLMVGRDKFAPARCRHCAIVPGSAVSTMALEDGDYWFCARCDERVLDDDIDYPRTESALMEYVAEALFPPFCRVCCEELVTRYASIVYAPVCPACF